MSSHGLTPARRVTFAWSGETVGNVSYRLGHADSRITQQVYERCIPGAQRATADRFQSILKNAESKAT